MFSTSLDHKIISANDNSFKWQNGHAYDLSGKWLGPCPQSMLDEVTKSGDVGSCMAKISEEAKKAKRPEESAMEKALDASASNKSFLKPKGKVIGRSE